MMFGYLKKQRVEAEEELKRIQDDISFLKAERLMIMNELLKDKNTFHIEDLFVISLNSGARRIVKMVLDERWAYSCHTIYSENSMSRISCDKEATGNLYDVMTGKKCEKSGKSLFYKTGGSIYHNDFGKNHDLMIPLNQFFPILNAFCTNEVPSKLVLECYYQLNNVSEVTANTLKEYIRK